MGQAEGKLYEAAHGTMDGAARTLHRLVLCYYPDVEMWKGRVPVKRKDGTTVQGTRWYYRDGTREYVVGFERCGKFWRAHIYL